jgi:hypothetical protein
MFKQIINHHYYYIRINQKWLASIVKNLILLLISLEELVTTILSYNIWTFKFLHDLDLALEPLLEVLILINKILWNHFYSHLLPCVHISSVISIL